MSELQRNGQPITKRHDLFVLNLPLPKRKHENGCDYEQDGSVDRHDSKRRRVI